MDISFGNHTSSALNMPMKQLKNDKLKVVFI